MTTFGHWRKLFDFATPRELRDAGVLGMNRRNADFILPENPRALYPRVDDKVLTKQICAERHIPTPVVYGTFACHGDLRGFAQLVADKPEFVIKPAKGSGGRGIVVIAQHDHSTYIKSDDEHLSLADVLYHQSSILSGLYSLGGQPDRVIVEQRIICHAAFRSISYGGTPDVRIILHRFRPVMAMIRLPTAASRGRANLHQGAIAAGVDLKTGRTSGGVMRNQPVSIHPDTGHSIEGFEIPQWEPMLAAAVSLAEGTGLGYTGVDFVVDASLGPVVLEANARPGLAIQIANRTGLLSALAAAADR